jgi:type IV pilus assembly protein PilB
VPSRRKKLGEMIVEEGLLTREQLQEALAEQRRTGLKLGEYLIRRGVLTESQIVDMLSRQMGIDRYEPEEDQPDSVLAGLVPADMARRLRLAPMKRKGNLLTVSMTDPMDIKALESVEVATNLEVEPIICTQDELDELLTTIYTPATDHQPPDETELLAHGLAQAAPSGPREAAPSEAPRPESPSGARIANAVLVRAVNEGASQVHIGHGRNGPLLRFRVDGGLREVPGPPREHYPALIARLKSLAGLDPRAANEPQEGRFASRMQEMELVFMLTTVPTLFGENLVLRVLDAGSPPELGRLGMENGDLERLRGLLEHPGSMVLCSGPAGSGVTTTLVALLRACVRPERNVMSLEDPVEHVLDHVQQAQFAPRPGLDFSGMLRALLRQDPDVLMASRLPDAASAVLAADAALEGRTVLGSVAVDGAPEAVARLLDMGLDSYRVNGALRAAVSQRLLRRNCPYCSEPYEPPADLVSDLLRGVDAGAPTFRRGTGCDHCGDTGRQGRVAVFECLFLDEPVQRLVERGAPAEVMAQAARGAGLFKPLRLSAVEKALSGAVALEEVAAVLGPGGGR